MHCGVHGNCISNKTVTFKLFKNLGVIGDRGLLFNFLFCNFCALYHLGLYHFLETMDISLENMRFQVVSK